MKRYLTILLPVLLLLATFAGAETISLKELLREAQSATRKNYPDSDTVLLYNHEKIRYEKTGLSESTDEFYQKVLTEKGRKDLRSMTLHYNSTYGDLQVEKLQIIRNGKLHKLDIASNTKRTIDASQMGSNIYDPANKLLTVTLPDVQTGDIIGIKIREKIRKCRIPGFWGNYIALQGDMPIRRYVVEVDAPAEKPLRTIRIKDPAVKVQSRERKEGSRIHYYWEVRDVPQAIPEPDMPPLYTSVQRLLMGTAENWQEISRWYSDLCRPRLAKVDDAIRKKVAELTADCKTPEEKIMALFQFVSQKIRYMGITPESEAPGYEPHDVTLTFHNRYGVCRDKAALLVAMLNIAGLKSYPVLIMAGIPKDDDVPNGYFNHAITAVELKKGEYILMDPTNESARELLPATLGNCSYLVARPKGDKLRRTPSPDAVKNSLLIQSEAEYDNAGTLTGKLQLTFNGVNDLIYRNALSHWSPEESEQYFRRSLSAAIPGAELKKMRIEPHPVRDMSKVLKVHLEYRAEKVLPQSGSPVVLQLPELGDSVGASGFLLGSFALEKRKFNLKLESTFSVIENFKLKLPLHLNVKEVPQAEELGESGLLRWRRKMVLRNRELCGERHFSVNSLEFTPEAYRKVRRTLQKIDMVKRALPVVETDYSSIRGRDMEKFFAGSEFLVLKDELRYTLRNRGTYEEEHLRKIRILNYAGVKSASELRVSYDPQQEEVSIRAEVRLPSGKIRELTDLERNIMDAPWNASAPRYPGEKILVANLPGVETGSEITTWVRKKVKKPFFAKLMTFGSHVPILEMSRIIDMPERMFLKHSSTPSPVKFNETTGGGRRIFTWQIRNVSRIVPERQQPALWNFVPTVAVSTTTWKERANRLNDTFQRLASPDKNPEAAALARKLTSALPASGSRQERLQNKIRVIRNFVSRSIRAAGPALDKTALEKLSTADITLRSGYGNSVDRAILLGAMLKSLDIEMEFLPATGLLYTPASVRMLERFPQQILDQVLVYVPETDTYLNDTSEYAEPGTLNSANRIALSLKYKRLESLREKYRFASWQKRRIEIKLKTDGSADLKITDTLSGSAFEQANRKYSEFTPELRKRHFESLASHLSRAAKITGTPESDFNSHPGRISYMVHCPGFAVRTGKHLIFDLPYFRSFAHVSGNVNKERDTPFERKEAQDIAIEYDITLPDTWRVSGSRPSKLELGDYTTGRFYQEYSSGRGKIGINCRLTIPAGVVPAADCGRLFKLRRQLAHPNAGKIILESKGETK